MNYTLYNLQNILNQGIKNDCTLYLRYFENFKFTKR